MPSSGSSTKPPASDPSADPSVLAKVSVPAASASDRLAARRPAPASVKITPETSETGSISSAPSASTSGTSVTRCEESADIRSRKTA